MSEILTSSFEKSWFFYNENMFEEGKVNYIRNICDRGIEEEALTSGSKEATHKIRKNKVSWHNDEMLYSLIRPTLAQVNQATGWNYHITGIEPIQHTIYYGDENHYDWHTDTIVHDIQDGPLTGTVRKLTMVIQLSDPSEYEGGEFEFIQTGGDERFKTETLNPGRKRKGACVVFPSFVYHRVKPVTRGVRRTLVCWFRGPKWI